MCSMNNPNWVTFEDECTTSTSPFFASTPLKIPGSGTRLASTPLKIPGSGTKLASTPLKIPGSGTKLASTPMKSPGAKIGSPPSYVSTALKTHPGSGTAPLHIPRVTSLSPMAPVPSPPSRGTRGISTHSGSGLVGIAWTLGAPLPTEGGGSSLPCFFIQPKDSKDPPRPDHLQNSYFYICHKLEGLQTGRTSGRDHQQKYRMSSRQWGPIYLRLLSGGVLQMYYEKGLEKPFKEFQLQPHCRFSDLKLESNGEPRKIQTVKVEDVSYTEKKRYHHKLEVSHKAEVEQLLKFGTTEYGDMEDLLETMEEEILRLTPPLSQKRHYEEQEMTLQIPDHLWVQLDKDGVIMDRAAMTRIHCLAFLNGPGECFLALNDLGLLRFDASFGSEEGWMEISDCHFHKCINDLEFHRSRLLKFSPPDACRVELMRYKTLALGCTNLPFSVKAVVTVQGAYVELQAFLNISAAFPSFTGVSETEPLYENVLIRVPVPADWVKVSRTVTLLRRKSLPARINRNACLGTVSVVESQPVMQVTVGTVKYENVYLAMVWRIDRLSRKSHTFSCKLELGSDQEIPTDWYPFVTMECEMVGAVVSQTRVTSLGTDSDVQPQKHVTGRTHYHCQLEIKKKWIETEAHRQSVCTPQ
uniref:Stonin 1 n=1 Tax=Oncorhynchus mykiss TaxID=8022 RepID=A0A8C7T9I7_ONCMY